VCLTGPTQPTARTLFQTTPPPPRMIGTTWTSGDAEEPMQNRVDRFASMDARERPPHRVEANRDRERIRFVDARRLPGGQVQESTSNGGRAGVEACWKKPLSSAP
jgi:hypothetical protein